MAKATAYFFLLLGLLFFFFTDSIAQKKSDIGIFGGTSYYMGDLNPSTHLTAPSFAIGPIYRYNLNPRASVRAHAIYHGLSGSSFYFPTNRVEEFNAKFVDLALNFEFNWFPYATANRKLTHSPYVFAGIGYGLKMIGTRGVASHVTTPFGLGYKLNAGRWLSVGVEAGPRKAWSDRVDGVQNPGFEIANPDFTLFQNRDWYIFAGVFVTYKIFKFWESCPTYDN